MPTELVAPDAATSPAAFENPLIPNAKLRQIYRAVLHARVLGESLPASQRRITHGLEAALVSTSIDLLAGDLDVLVCVAPK